MPLYEYNCASCGRFEVIRKFSDPPLKKCPKCGRKVEKQPSAPAIQFKGSGWYVTDYAGKGKEDKPADTGADKKPAADAKPETSKKAETGKKAGGKVKAGG